MGGEDGFTPQGLQAAGAVTQKILHRQKKWLKALNDVELEELSTSVKP